ncbi:MAG: DUF87 domain-containing protein [Oscillospiraceae bacterium]|nr:DUF87 domain-containing protein [Oscillospiraceae bacterium]
MDENENMMNGQQNENAENEIKGHGDSGETNPQQQASTIETQPTSWQLEEEGLNMADSFVQQSYLSALSSAEVATPRKELLEIAPGTNLRLMKLDKLFYTSRDELKAQISDLYASLCWSGSSLCYIVDARSEKADFYLGVSMDDEQQLSSAKRFFGGTMSGTVPGLSFRNMRVPQQEELLKDLIDDDRICVASVSLADFDSSNSGDQQFSAGIERLLDGMYGKPFTSMVLSRYMQPQEIAAIRRGYEEIYTQLSQYQRMEFSISEGDNDSTSQAYGTSKTESINESISISNSHTDGKTVAPEPPRQKQAAITSAIGLAAGIATMVAFPGPGGAIAASGVSQAASTVAGVVTGAAQAASGNGGSMNPFYINVGTTIGNTLNTMINGFFPVKGEEHRTTNQESDTLSESKQKGTSISEATSWTETNTVGRTSSSSRSMSVINQTVVDLLSRIDAKIKNLTRLEATGAYDTCVYFIASTRETVLSAANQFRAELSCTKAQYTALPVNVWDRKEDTEVLSQYLSRMHHPVFRFKDQENYPMVTGAQPVSTVDMAAVLKLPQRVVNGMEMGEYASYAPSLSCDSKKESFSVGRLVHMGKCRSNEVRFTLDSMVRHMFVSGMTGMGKSNFCYLLVDELVKHGKKVLVIEPAKGQYSQVFGGRDDFHCYGTNPRFSEVLRLNPFSFPDEVHVSEHIERLIGIFSACWPLYAAMPAMLKDAVEMCYEECGFDLETGERAEDSRFPTFDDLLRALPKIIESSAYSDRSKGDYSGSLITRVKSLTNGIFRQIFTADEMTSEELFGENVIIDLSRVGGAESKALIMGILVMRLSEYRSSENLMDSPLRHVTFLEEAHHLLRADAHGYSEGANVQEASTEMITNAIAEIRTYGEGFVIADQAPAMMDQATIRNTYTKVVFKLPYEADRKSVGAAMALNQSQLDHIARLQIGEAVIYQGGWNEAVLCKTDFFSPDNFKPLEYTPKKPKPRFSIPVEKVKSEVLRMLLSEEPLTADDLKLCRDITSDRRMHAKLDDVVWDFLNDCLIDSKNSYSSGKLARVVYSAADGSSILKELNSMEKTPARFDWLLETLGEKFDLPIELCVKLSDMLLTNSPKTSGALSAAWTGYKGQHSIY